MCEWTTALHCTESAGVKHYINWAFKSVSVYVCRWRWMYSTLHPAFKLSVCFKEVEQAIYDIALIVLTPGTQLDIVQNRIEHSNLCVNESEWLPRSNFDRPCSDFASYKLLKDSKINNSKTIEISFKDSVSNILTKYSRLFLNPSKNFASWGQKNRYSSQNLT